MILDGINEYFQWFSGDKSAFMETDLVLYIPKYNGGKAEVSVNGNSRSLVPVNDQDEYMALFDPSSSGHPSKEQVEKLVKELGETPKIGYKVSYSIS